MALDPHHEIALCVAQFEAAITAMAWQVVADVMAQESRRVQFLSEPVKEETTIKELARKASAAGLELDIKFEKVDKETKYLELLKKGQTAGLWTRDGKVFYRCVEFQESMDDPHICKMLSRDGKRTVDVKFDTVLNRWQFFPESEVK